MKKNRLLMLLAVPLMMSLAGCGNNDKSLSEGPSIPDVSDVSEPSAPTSTPTTGQPSETPSTESSTPSVNPSETPSVEPSVPSVPSDSTSKDSSVVPPVSTPDPSTSVEPDEPPVIDPNYGGELAFVSAESGDESIHIEGAGVWIWVTSSSIGYVEGTNAIEDFNLEVEMTKGSTTITESKVDLVGEIRDRVRVYITLHDAPGANVETAFDLKITNPNGKYYVGSVEFIGKTWSENVTSEPPVVDPDDPVDPDKPNYGGELEFVSTNSGNERIRIIGDQAWIWVKASSMGYVKGSTDLEDFTAEAEVTKGNVFVNSVELSLSGNFEDRVRAYVILSGAPSANDETAILLRITDKNGKYYENTIEFIGGDWTEAEQVEKENGGSFALYLGANEISRIGNDVVWIYVNSQSIGLTKEHWADEWADIKITNAKLVDNTDYNVSRFLITAPGPDCVLVQVFLDRGLADDDTTTSLTFNIRIENATHYYTGTVSFLGTSLAE